MDAPACLVPATIAHEMSHQRMVFSELEANFVGIAAAVSCGDPVFQYSGWLMGLIQLCNALYAVSPDLWYQIAAASFTPEPVSYTHLLSSSRKKFSIANFSFLTQNKGCFD